MGFQKVLLTVINGIFLYILGPKKNENSELEAPLHQEFNMFVG